MSSDLEKRVAAAKQASEWQDCGLKSGIEVFRIEKLQVKRIPANQFGTFYDGDAYIVLHTNIVKEEKSWDIHFWLGTNCSIDEQTVAAIKTVELDDFFGGKPTQFRETQGNESDKFLSYFPSGVKVLKGGIASGFHHAAPTPQAPRLIQFKGRKVIQSIEVAANASSMNHGDAFVLETGAKIFIWKGKDARQMEKFAASQYADQLKHDAKIQVIHLDEEGNDEFWGMLKGSKKDVKSAQEGGDDSKTIKKSILYRISDASGSIKFTKVAEGKDVKMNKFDTNDVFLFDAGSVLYVWCGKKATAQEKRAGMNNAMKYIKENNLPNSLPVERILEGEESGGFKNAMK